MKPPGLGDAGTWTSSHWPGRKVIGWVVDRRYVRIVGFMFLMDDIVTGWSDWFRGSVDVRSMWVVLDDDVDDDAILRRNCWMERWHVYNLCEFLTIRSLHSEFI